MADKNRLEGFELAKKVAELALNKKAQDVVILDLKGLTTLADYFVICSGTTDIQVKAISESISEGLSREDSKPWKSEGLDTGTWVLMDFVDVVLHIFHSDKRAYYRLEELWGDAEVTKISEDFIEN